MQTKWASLWIMNKLVRLSSNVFGQVSSYFSKIVFFLVHTILCFARKTSTNGFI
jgi:hypothetical protein